MAARSRSGAIGILPDFFLNLPKVAGGGWGGLRWVEEEEAGRRGWVGGGRGGGGGGGGPKGVT
jgi:hypothetical protein